ncbi:MAG: LacI family DNA-binding transcriptional regulator [Chloroflexota bacterium]|nr:LacI family DNA-binding transcriptional regulator [Chloroflexota bacterium]
MNLEDVAKQAGVSRSTVSRVVNNEGYVSDETRARVLEVIERLNFSPNHAARALVKQRSDVVGVVMPGTANVFFGDNSYFPMLLQGIAEAADQREYNMMLCLGHPNEDREAFSRRIIRNRIADGLIIASISGDDPLIDRLIKAIPYFVMVERPLYHEDAISYVTADNLRGGQIATEHLINLGYRRIAHITGHLNISDGQDRLVGYRRALERAGIPFNPDLVHLGRFSYDAGYHSMKALLEHHPDAVFVSSDTAALGAMRAIQDAGLRIPDDIGVVVFDDLDVAVRATPALTTIRQPVQKKGEAAFALLLDLINGAIQSPHQIILPVQLVIRQSCGANP